MRGRRLPAGDLTGSRPAGAGKAGPRSRGQPPQAQALPQGQAQGEEERQDPLREEQAKEEQQEGEQGQSRHEQGGGTMKKNLKMLGLAALAATALSAFAA